MMTMLFFSRALLSVSMMTFVAFSFFHRDIKKQFTNFFSSPLLWGMSLLFFLPLLSGLWSDDKKEWMDLVRIKLPLVFLPIAFAGPVNFSKKQLEWQSYVLIGLVTAGTCWSMFHYLPDSAAINESYLKAKTMMTPLGNDHVRFSWLVSVAILFAGWMAISKRKEQKSISVLLTIIIIWLIIFLHILAARTGIISFYIIIAGAALWLGTKLKWKYALLLIVGLVALPLIAYKSLPSFQNRIKYFVYDSGFFKKGIYLAGSNDAVRMISIKAGWNILQQHPATGVGWGDVLQKADRWYDDHYSGMIESDKIYPASEWMMYGAGCGWPGFLIFSFVMTIPFFIGSGNNKLAWWLLNITAAFSFLFDIGLETQFGVFIYSFIILWAWQWINAEEKLPVK